MYVTNNYLFFSQICISVNSILFLCHVQVQVQVQVQLLLERVVQHCIVVTLSQMFPYPDFTLS